jgi:hypothetical protein
MSSTCFNPVRAIFRRYIDKSLSRTDINYDFLGVEVNVLEFKMCVSMLFFLLVCYVDAGPPKPRAHLSALPYVPHAPPISFL